ncbi:MAG TPA: ABC transporter ATP-binding protein [Dissulfurispiraceae bacterium]|nr:ABC transporter ATP-binding protein [Dissulfurispiraceae bacterium]
MLSLRSVNASYGPIKALKDIDLEVKSGEIVCLLGSNGAGKSTTLMTISGILRPDSGEIIFDGESIAATPPDQIVRKGICQVPEGRRIFPRLSVLDNLEVGAFSAAAGDFDRNLEKVFSIFPILKERIRQQGGTLSGGEQQMLAIGRSLMSNPKLLLLDEPSLGLAPIMVSRIFKVIQEINKEGITVLLVEQNARAALKLSNRGYVLENGAIQLCGTGDELLDNDAVKKAYLGL